MTRRRWCCYWFVCLFALLLLVGGCGGAPTPEPVATVEPTPELSPDGQGIVCDLFELRWELDGTDLLLAIDTDLPDEGELSVSVGRTYYESGSDDAYSRDYFSEFELVSRWREPRRIGLDADAWKADLTAHQNRMAGIGDDLAFEIARIEDSINIRAVLHINQDDPRFGGRGNPSLSGEATSRMGNGDSVLVESEASTEFPLSVLSDNEEGAVSSACTEAFAMAASISEFQDTHEDLFPAYSACTSLEEWEAANALYPAAIDGVAPIRYAMTVCANNQEELRETPICRAVNAPPAADASSIKASGRTGLLGAPLPEGAQLTEQTPGNLAAGRDPTESYAISATAVDIAAFFNQAMPGSGWSKDGTSTETVLFFQKGNLILGVLIGGDGGSFLLMGS